MNETKLQTEMDTLKLFLEEYCHANGHSFKELQNFTCRHNNLVYSVDSTLCRECSELMRYSLVRLEACPHDIKPRCRKCPNPCYEKNEWKALARIMRFSGLRLGLIELKKKVRDSLKRFI